MFGPTSSVAAAVVHPTARSAWREVRDWLLAVAAVGGVCLAYIDGLSLTDPTIAALSFLLIVVVVAAQSTLRVAIAASVAAAVAFNYFFLSPVGTLAIDEHQDWFAFLTLIVVSGVVSRLSTRARARTADALARGEELQRFLAVTRELLDERRQSELARQSTELKSMLLASLGHDLRTPLTALAVASNNLRADELPAAERHAQVALIQSEVHRLQRLFDKLVDMARVETNAVVVEPQWVDPNEIVHAAAEGLGRAVAGRLMLSDRSDDLSVRIDPRLTAKALTHVLENAVQYAPPDTPIEVTVIVEGGRLRLMVRDHGPGIPSADLERVFDRFYRGPAAGPFGTGMGLAIARGLLTAQAGGADAANHRDGGAVFALSVPVEVRAQALVLEEAR